MKLEIAIPLTSGNEHVRLHLCSVWKRNSQYQLFSCTLIQCIELQSRSCQRELADAIKTMLWKAVGSCACAFPLTQCPLAL